MNQRALPPRSAQPILIEIDCALRTGQLDRVVALAQAALDAGIRNPALHNLRARALRQVGRLEEALADLRQSQKLDPRAASTPADIAACLNELGRFNQAIAAAKEAIARDPDLPQPWYQIGLGHQMLRQLDAARNAYLEAIRLDPNFADALVRLAGLAELAGNDEEARAFALRAERVQPGHPGATTVLVNSDLAAGRLTSAEPRIEALLANPSVAPVLRAITLSQLGDLRDAQGRTHEAYQAYCRAGAMWKNAYAHNIL
ncbi:MAG TPA: tetratricopeptide repeat protein [Rhizomicrobium sp.]|nr:tetratricopeptide repeat protein [Rhizomicrobium sp.]